MRRKISVPACTPRNRVVIALALLARMGSGRHQPNKRQKARDRKDLDQRVRDVGEW